MDYVLTEWDHDLDDEPCLIYSELDDGRMERRKVEFFRNGICFSYGAERGNQGGPLGRSLPGGPADCHRRGRGVQGKVHLPAAVPGDLAPHHQAGGGAGGEGGH